MKTRDIPIRWNNKDEVVTIKRLTFGERAQLMREARDIKFVSGVQSITVNEEKLRIKTVMFGIEKAPFDHTNEQVIKDLDGNLGEQIYSDIDDFNTLKDEKKNKTEERNKNRIHES